MSTLSRPKPAFALAFSITCVGACLDESAAPITPPSVIATGGRPGTGGAPAGTGGAPLLAGTGGASAMAGTGGTVAIDAGSSDGGGADLPPPADASADGGPTTPPAFGFEAVKCWFALKPELAMRFATRCGYVTVPENRAKPDGARTRVFVTVISKVGRPAIIADPVVYLSGGPGGAGVVGALGLLGSATRAGGFAQIIEGGRDAVGIDQRGTGDSLPSLTCKDTEMLDPCMKRLATVADLSQYNSATTADDVEAVRKALGYGPWNLLGISFGTRIGLEVMRRHPAGVRSMILDGVVPPDLNTIAEVGPNLDRTVKELEAACNRDPACAKAYPGLYQRYLALGGAPAFTFMHEGGMRTVLGSTVLGSLRSFAYSWSLLPDLPEIIEQLRERRESTFKLYFTPGKPALRPSADGVYYSVRCADTSPAPIKPGTEAAIGMLDPLIAAFSSHRSLANSCAKWMIPPAPPANFLPVPSALPTLLVSGHFDPATPPSAADRVAGSLTRAAHHVVLDGSHSGFDRTCAMPSVLEFLGNPTGVKAIKWACPGGTPTIKFNVPETRLGGGMVGREQARLAEQSHLAGMAERFATAVATGAIPPPARE